MELKTGPWSGQAPALDQDLHIRQISLTADPEVQDSRLGEVLGQWFYDRGHHRLTFWPWTGEECIAHHAPNMWHFDCLYTNEMDDLPEDFLCLRAGAEVRRMMGYDQTGLKVSDMPNPMTQARVSGILGAACSCAKPLGTLADVVQPDGSVVQTQGLALPFTKSGARVDVIIGMRYDTPDPQSDLVQDNAPAGR